MQNTLKNSTILTNKGIGIKLLETLHAHNNNWFFAPFLTGFPPDSAKIDGLFLSDE